MTIVETIFWVSLLFVCFVTFGYPFVLAFWGLFVRTQSIRGENDEKDLPAVSMIIAAYNEEKVIGAKIKNSLDLDYPPEKLEIIVASDGSGDRTDEIANSFREDDVRLFRYGRMGKTGIQNESVRKANGEIIVFSDANAMYQKTALLKLIRHFTDPKIGCVCGQLVYNSNERRQAGDSEISYWKYEKFIKTMESKVSSLIGVNGSIYAIRKSDYVEIDPDYISDLVEPLEIVKNGKRVIYEPEAVSEEDASASIEEEFNRKVRILTRSIRGFLLYRELCNPKKYGIFSLQIILHKLCRYLVPAFLLSGAISLVALSHSTFYLILYLLMILVLIFAMISKFSGHPIGQRAVFRHAYYYIVVNYAIVLAWIRIIKNQKITVWSPSRK